MCMRTCVCALFELNKSIWMNVIVLLFIAEDCYRERGQGEGMRSVMQC